MIIQDGNIKKEKDFVLFCDDDPDSLWTFTSDDVAKELFGRANFATWAPNVRKYKRYAHLYKTNKKLRDSFIKPSQKELSKNNDWELIAIIPKGKVPFMDRYYDQPAAATNTDILKRHPEFLTIPKSWL